VADELSLLDISALIKTPIESTVMLSMFKGRLPSPIDFIPTKTVAALSMQTARVTEPDSPTTRNLGGSAGVYKAKVSDRTETLKIIQDKVTLDVVYLSVKNYIEDPIELQFRVYGQVLKADLNNLFIAGDPSADETEPEGLDYRLRNDATFINMSVDAGALDVDNNDANRNSWLDKIDETITLVGGGAPEICIINRQTWLRLRSALRNLKLLDTTKDQHDREIMQLYNTKFLNAGQTAPNVLTPAAAGQIITDDGATSIFGDASTTPMYFLDIAGPEGVKLLQMHNLKSERLGVNPNDPAEYVVSMLYPMGINVPQKFAIGSLQGLDIT
jgi:hypothetical protein